MLRQAVYIVLRDADYAEAEKIMARQERFTKPKAQEDKALKKKLNNFISKEDENNPELQEHNFGNFLTEMTSFLEPLCKTFPTPFLVKAATKVVSEEQRLQRFNNNNNNSIADLSFTESEKGDIKPKLMKLIKAKENSISKEDQSKIDEIRKRNRSERGKKASTHGPTSSTPKKSAEGTLFPAGYGDRKKRRMAVREMVNTAEEERVTWSSDEEATPVSKFARMRQQISPTLLRNRNVSSTSKYKSEKVGRRIPWTLNEEEKLYKAVQKYGVGSWCRIIETGSFPLRRNVQLKDKWRTMLNTKSVDQWIKKYGMY
ncbi:unnamed protein product [Owenia fusiformis]|uniref:Uncharacterized protein n=2 Tax=Owenia fusiformis TaxID=6347 RepID=A0A8S4NNM8_OWEFU|nr:unnamed protein product [Owenia fusiformis]